MNELRGMTQYKCYLFTRDMGHRNYSVAFAIKDKNQER